MSLGPSWAQKTLDATSTQECTMQEALQWYWSQAQNRLVQAILLIRNHWHHTNINWYVPENLYCIHRPFCTSRHMSDVWDSLVSWTTSKVKVEAFAASAKILYSTGRSTAASPLEKSRQCLQNSGVLLPHYISCRLLNAIVTANVLLKIEIPMSTVQLLLKGIPMKTQTILMSKCQELANKLLVASGQ